MEQTPDTYLYINAQNYTSGYELGNTVARVPYLAFVLLTIMM